MNIPRKTYGAEEIAGLLREIGIMNGKGKAAVKAVREQHRISERRACRMIGQPRSSQRYQAKRLADEGEITAQIVELAGAYGRYGYRMNTAILRGKGYRINHKLVYRICTVTSIFGNSPPRGTRLMRQKRNAFASFLIRNLCEDKNEATKEVLHTKL